MWQEKRRELRKEKTHTPVNTGEPLQKGGGFVIDIICLLENSGIICVRTLFCFGDGRRIDFDYFDSVPSERTQPAGTTFDLWFVLNDIFLVFLSKNLKSVIFGCVMDDWTWTPP